MTHYACHDRLPFVDRTTLRDHHGRVMATWPAVMAKDCRYSLSDLGQQDKKCDGCKWRAEVGHG
mgnify:FL=1